MGTKCLSNISVTNVFNTGPVTALVNYEQFVIAGVGGSLLIYDTQERIQCGLQYVLPCRNVHGIKRKFDENVLCVYGEKCFRLAAISANSAASVDISDETVVLEDWILDITWLKDPETTSSSQLAVALAHNVILLWNVPSRTLAQRVNCVEKCILYCAHLFGTSWTDLVLAAGTVFNQVILWSPSGTINDMGQREVLHRLQGHQGVIFSIDYHLRSRVIASVSDDRTIRLWTLTFPSGGESVRDWEGVVSSPLLTLYGHSARVWDIELLDNIFVSVGEDATCLVWDYSGKILHKFKGHKGKSIWSLACDRNEKFVVTGGGDTSIRMWILENEDDDGRQDTVHRSLSVPRNDKVQKEDFPRSIALSDIDTILAMTNEGRLLKHTVQSATWTLLDYDPQFFSYTVMAVSPDGSHVAVGNITGIVKVFDISTCAALCSTQLYTQKVFGLVWVDTGHLLTTGPQGDMYLLSVPSLCKTANLTLPVCKQRWASAGVLCPQLSVLVCGDRGGTVHSYDISQAFKEAPIMPVSSFAKIHGKAGVTDVCYYGNTIYTAGRDGQYRQWDITERELKLRSLHKVMKGMDWIDRVCVSEEDTLIYGFHSSHFTLWSVGQNLRLIDVECGGGHRAWDCQLDGGQARFVYLKTKQIAICDTTCRSRQVILKASLHGRELCDVKHLATFSVGSVTFTKLLEEVMKHHYASRKEFIIRNCVPQEISFVEDQAIPPRRYCFDRGQVHILATCSEDTTVQLVSVTACNGISDLRVLHTLQGHLSSVRTLAISPAGSCGTRISRHKISQRVQHEERTSSATGCAGELSDGPTCVNETEKMTDPIEDVSEKGEDQISHEGKIIFSGGGRAQMQVWKVNVASPSNTDETSGTDKDSTTTKCGYSENRSAERTEMQTNSEETAYVYSGCPGQQTSHSSFTNSINYHKVCNYEHLACVFLCGESERTKSSGGSHPQSDPETRVMCLTALCLREVEEDYPSTLHVVAAACSDTYIKVFGFDENRKCLSLLQQSNYHKNCVLKVDHIIHQSHAKSKVILLSGATEGHLAFWDITEICKLYVESARNLQQDKVANHSETNSSKLSDSLGDKIFPRSGLKPYLGHKGDSRYRKSMKKNILKTLQMTLDMKFLPLRTIQVHQSGINSVQSLHLGEGRYLIASGGDDNCVTVTTVWIQDGGDDGICVDVEKCRKNLSAHAAQVTGVWLLSDRCVVSVSIDQRVCVWELSDCKDTAFTMVGCRFVHFSDISNLDVWRDGCWVFLYVCGEGLSVVQIETS